MTQQINLYQPIFRRQRKVFSSATIAQIVAVIAIGLLLIYGFGRWQTGALEREVAEIERQRDAAEARMRELSEELAARRTDAALEAAIAAASEELEARRRLLEWMGSRGEADAGFAGHLEALARQHRQGLWLTALVIEDGGRTLRLEGGTQDAQELVRYLRRLGGESAFSDVVFRTVRIERDPAEAGGARFVVASRAEVE